MVSKAKRDARWKLGAGLVALAALSSRGHAQVLPVAVGHDTGYEAEGIPAGGFRVYPTVRVALSYDDNVYLRESNIVGDTTVTTRAAVSAQSQWSSHALNLNAFLTDARYFKLGQNDHDEYGASAAGRLDVLRTLHLTGSANYGHLVEGRGSPGGTFTGGRFIHYDVVRGSAGIVKQLNRVILTVDGNIGHFRYQDTDLGNGLGPIDQSFRNRQTLGTDVRVDYQYSAVTRLFVRGAYNEVNYDHISGVDRGSHGYRLLGGVSFQITRFLTGEASVGGLKQVFRSPVYANFSGLDYDVDLTYRPTELTTVRVFANRQLTDSSLANVGAVLTSQVGVSASHELLRNLEVTAGASYVQDKYRGIGGTGQRIFGSASARYSFNRVLAASIGYNRQQQLSSQLFSGYRYSGNVYNVSLILSR